MIEGLPKPLRDDDSTTPRTPTSPAGMLALFIIGIAFLAVAIGSIGEWDFSRPGSGRSRTAIDGRPESRLVRLGKILGCSTLIWLVIGWMADMFWVELRK